MNFDLDFPKAHGGPIAQAILKATPQDFIVAESLSFPLSGEGEHLYLHIRKTNANTQWVCRQLARQLGVRQRDIGYAGLKDRHGITSQWFSLPAKPNTAARLEVLAIEGVELLEVQTHARKLRKGAIKHNHFTIRLRELAVDPAILARRLAVITTKGVPNYFDEQRFGHQRGNLDAAEQMFARRIKPSRFQRGLYLSAARAWLFNCILAQRVADQTWDQALPGDVFRLAGSKRFFVPEPLDPAIPQRLAQGDIHPTGALWGEGELASHDAVAQLEKEIAGKWPVLTQGLLDARVTQDRRPLRVIPEGLTHCYEPLQQTLELSFSLPAGAYATALLREIVLTQLAQADHW